MAAIGLIGLALPAAPAFAQAKVLKISHQFPGGTIDEGDFRDRMVRRFAAEVEKQSKGALNPWRLTAIAYKEDWVANSIWSPKLWIPFAFIAGGMSLLALQYLVQIVDDRVLPLLRKDRDGRA